MNIDNLKNTLEAALLAAGTPVSVNKLLELFANESDRPARDDVKQALQQLGDDYEGKAIELVEVSSGFRLQVRQSEEPVIARLWDEKPPRYSRALLETLALIAYRQPITRAEIEDIRGVSVSTQIIRMLLEREWVRVVGHREVPGKPAMYGTTRQFLDYFNLKRLDDLPPLMEIRDIDRIHPELALDNEASTNAENTDDGENRAETEAVSQTEPESGAEAEHHVDDSAPDDATDEVAIEGAESSEVAESETPPTTIH
ncbi:MAG: SMC-Scp complex subunit ScpB [Pseudomonadota bacterium]